MKAVLPLFLMEPGSDQEVFIIRFREQFFGLPHPVLNRWLITIRLKTIPCMLTKTIQAIKSKDSVSVALPTMLNSKIPVAEITPGPIMKPAAPPSGPLPRVLIIKPGAVIFLSIGEISSDHQN